MLQHIPESVISFPGRSAFRPTYTTAGRAEARPTYVTEPFETIPVNHRLDGEVTDPRYCGRSRGRAEAYAGKFGGQETHVKTIYELESLQAIVIIV